MQVIVHANNPWKGLTSGWLFLLIGVGPDCQGVNNLSLAPSSDHVNPYLNSGASLVS